MVFEKVKTILKDQLDIEDSEITMDARIQEDLKADSLDLMDLIVALGDEFDVEISDDEVENIKTVGDLVNYIEAHK